MSSQTYNIGRRKCSKCKFEAHIIFPEFGKTGYDDWVMAKETYLDNYVKAFGWTLKNGKWVCCKCSSKG